LAALLWLHQMSAADTPSQHGITNGIKSVTTKLLRLLVYTILRFRPQANAQSC